MWSIGNEIQEQADKVNGGRIAKELVSICKDEDPTRPTTAGFNYYRQPIKNGLAEAVDLVGWNYKPRKYKEVLSEHPEWIVYGSETSSTVSSRGVYHLPLEKYRLHPSLQITSYDFIGPPWAYPPDIEFEAIDKQPVDVVFSLFAPKSAGVEHLKALALVSRTLREQSTVAKLRSNPDPTTIYTILTEPANVQAA